MWPSNLTTPPPPSVLLFSPKSPSRFCTPHKPPLPILALCHSAIVPGAFCPPNTSTYIHTPPFTTHHSLPLPLAMGSNRELLFLPVDFPILNHLRNANSSPQRLLLPCILIRCISANHKRRRFPTWSHRTTPALTLEQARLPSHHTLSVWHKWRRLHACDSVLQ